jgi:hypothetical protein
MKDTLVRGRYLSDGWLTATNKFLIGGFDASRGENQSGYTNVDITLLREYDHNGDTLHDMRSDNREISSLYKYPDNSFIATTPNRMLRIDASFNITTNIVLNNTYFPGSSNIYTFAVSPSMDGGAFFTLYLNNQTGTNSSYNTYVNGYGLHKLNASNTNAYYKNVIPGDTMFSAPLLLPGSTSKYVGTATLRQVSAPSTVSILDRKIYELTDNGTSYSYRVGDSYPNGTALKAVSQVDGFFSCGTDATGNAAIAKLSTCAQFKLDVGATSENYMVQFGPATFPGRTITYTGSQGTVSCKWELSDITPGGPAATWTGASSDNTTTIPSTTFSLNSGKDFALVRYVVTAIDTYSDRKSVV